jgi:threonyl-tRNA synthetase
LEGKREERDAQQIYATAWNTYALAVESLQIEEAKKRDRALGKKLDLFSIQEDAGGGLVRRKMEDFWKESHLT